MGPSFNFSNLQEDFASNPLPLKVNLPHGFVDRPELFIKEACSDVESSLKRKRRKSAANEGGLEDQGPMLGLVVSSPGSDNVLCNNLSTLDQDETLVCSPSFNSALDIRKFPLMLSDITESNSPKEKFEKCLQDNKCDTNDKLENCSRIPNVKPNPEEILPKELHQEKNKVVNKVKTLLSSLTENPLTNAGLVNAQDPGSPILEGQTFRKPKLPIVSCEPPILKESINVPKNETTKCITNPSDHSGRISGKRRIRKNLSLYFEEVKPGTYKINDKTSKSYCDDENRRPLKGRTTKSKRMKKSKLNWTLDDDELVCLSQISGVGNLQPNPIKDVNCEKVSNVFDGNQSHVPEAKFGTPRHREDKSSKVNVQNHKLQERTASLHLANWKNQVQLFCDSDVCIEDFDEESPIERADIINRVEAKKVDSVKRNLNNFESDVSTKQLYPEPKSMFLNFEPDNQNNTCEYPSSEDSCCDVEIQEDFSQRTFARSPAFKIEYSTTPNTKSSEETQNETDLQPPSFPPALEIDVNTASSAVIIDSACKNKRTRVKKGSLVERLRRLVRGQRAEVNMFHHEISAPRTNTKTCSLSVVSTTQACSLLMLNCRYTDASRTSSQDYGSGEEIVDPEVHVYVDPSYTKNIREGCNITVFPPWRSLWYESRGVVVMYQVTKIRLETTDHQISLPVVEGRQPSHTSVAQFACQTQDELCGCRNQLVSQLFTAPLLSVQPHNAADGALTAALAGGWYPHRVKVKLTLLHRYQARCHQNKVQTRILCVDSGGLMCQLNLRSEEDILKLGLWKESEGKTFVMRKLTVSRRVFIDRSRGLRSFLSYLHPESSSQQIMYVATPADDWTAQLIETTADKQPRITIHQQKLLTLPIEEEVEGRAKLQVRVMAVRRDELFAWEPRLDLYVKLNITSTAAVPNFPARACLDMSYIWAHQGELTIDKFTEVSIVELKDEDSPNIPPLAVDSAEGNLVLLDSIVTKVSSDAYLRWEGSCGHKVMRVQKTGQFYCLTCRQTSASSTQKVVLEVCVVAVDIPHLIRVKVKSETARVLLAETSGQISSEKSYNMIGVIGSTLKCLAVVSEVLRNSFGDIIEFVLEEL
ncbi:uncharacterized protein LOC128982380 [Macrosteles quadrilineatus]|uniref:uncharacterized protein LOC128982380 n=1 Tax=Macrosteles quadrilineatus TaxID=74068 RepID=UPI0023E17518|nr:uncharacterized protein LOC128982380 [Macrosteles quadrilineatus]